MRQQAGGRRQGGGLEVSGLQISEGPWAGWDLAQAEADAGRGRDRWARQSGDEGNATGSSTRGERSVGERAVGGEY